MSAFAHERPRRNPRAASAGEPLSGATRVMLVDDSIVARSILEHIIESEGPFKVVASLPTAAEAIEALPSSRPDIIVLDIDMPGMSGLTALPIILGKAHGARVLILSANCEEGGPAAVEAMARGAADTLIKPGRGTFVGRFGQTLINRLHALGHTEAPPAPDAITVSAIAPRAARALHSQTISAIGIGASTGGIMAINAFLSALPRTIDCPILITQHLPGGFMPFFADQLLRLFGRPVKVADDGMAVKAGHIYLAPGEGHIALSQIKGGVRIMIDRSPAPSGATPSVDPMLSTMAEVYGDKACGVILSGMGRDGIEGARRLRTKGGVLLAQDIESCVVWGMPGAVVREGLADTVGNPASLAKALAAMILPGAAAA